jgi:hypothetical protein
VISRIPSGSDSAQPSTAPRRSLPQVARADLNDPFGFRTSPLPDDEREGAHSTARRQGEFRPIRLMPGKGTKDSPIRRNSCQTVNRLVCQTARPCYADSAKLIELAERAATQGRSSGFSGQAAVLRSLVDSQAG